MYVIETSGPVAIFGAVDAMKLRSSLTLFEAAEGGPAIGNVLERCFAGERDGATQRKLGDFAKATD